MAHDLALTRILSNMTLALGLLLISYTRTRCSHTLPTLVSWTTKHSLHILSKHLLYFSASLSCHGSYFFEHPCSQETPFFTNLINLSCYGLTPSNTRHHFPRHLECLGPYSRTSRRLAQPFFLSKLDISATFLLH